MAGDGPHLTPRRFQYVHQEPPTTIDDVMREVVELKETVGSTHLANQHLHGETAKLLKQVLKRLGQLEKEVRK
jgi:hypothetical protein